MVPDGVKPQVVDGEAWWHSKDLVLLRSWLEEHRVSLGIHKRVVLSDAAREARFAALKSVRNARTEHNQPEAVHG